MTKDLVSGLARLHSGDYLHRDIRSPNTLYDPATARYFFIDFEHGGREGVVDEPWLREWDEGTLDDGRYTKMSEMYQLGKVLRKEYSLTLSEHGKIFVAALEGKKVTAQEALQHQWILDVQ
jgi:serine/threonine protein kinase